MSFFFLYIQRQYFSGLFLAKYATLADNCYLTYDKSIECKYKSPFQRLLSISVFPPQEYPTNVLVQVKIGINTKYANKRDIDFYTLLSDGYHAMGFGVYDRSNYHEYEPCGHVEAKPGDALTHQQMYKNGPLVSKNNLVPQAYEFLLNTKQKWGTCITSTGLEGSYTTSGHYKAQLYPSKGLTLDIYSDNEKGEIYNFKYITVDIEKDYL